MRLIKNVVALDSALGENGWTCTIQWNHGQQVSYLAPYQSRGTSESGFVKEGRKVTYLGIVQPGYRFGQLSYVTSRAICTLLVIMSHRLPRIVAKFQRCRLGCMVKMDDAGVGEHMGESKHGIALGEGGNTGRRRLGEPLDSTIQIGGEPLESLPRATATISRCNGCVDDASMVHAPAVEGSDYDAFGKRR